VTAQTASERLADALDAAAHRGETWPCRDDEGWTSEDADERAEAARRCTPCPVTALCHEAALEMRPTWSVFAGIDWSDRKSRPKRASA